MRGDNDPPSNEPRLFARFEHSCQPINRRVGIAAANALDERAGRVVVLVVAVLHGFLLDGFLSGFEIDRGAAIVFGEPGGVSPRTKW